MEKNLYFDYAAIVLEIVLLSCILVRKMTNGRMNCVFVFLITTALLTTSMDILAVAFDGYGPGYIIEKYFFHTGYLLLRAFTSFFYLSYIIVLTDTWFKAMSGLIKKVVLFLPIGLVVALVISNFWTHNLFYLDEHDVYTRGNMFIWLYIVNFYYIAYSIVKIFRYSRYMEREKILSLLFAFGMVITAAIVQFIIPRILVDMFAYAIGLLLAFILVHRPEEIVDTDTGLMRTVAYVRDMRQSLDTGKKETLIMINVSNFHVIREMIGYNYTLAVKKRIAYEITEYFRTKSIPIEAYYIGSGAYRVRSMGREYDAEDAANYFNDLFKESEQYGGIMINMTVCVCIVRLSEDITSFEALAAFESGLNDEYTGNVLYGSEICRKVRYNLVREMDTIIENALRDDEFEVVYQPIWSLHQKKYASAEALVRLNTKKYGPISPELIIPAAEKSGAIHRLGMYILENVCEFISSEEFERLGLDYIEVNLSPVQCLQNNLAGNITEILKKHNVPPEKLNLEITETATFEGHSSVMNNITKLNKAGIGLSLDDFGTGYSNMTRIASMPFSLIKLDKSLTDVDNNPNLAIVVENLVKMIKSLGMKIVVEGVEDEHGADLFDGMGCEYIQGYYYSKPLKKNDMISFIEASLSNQ